MDSKDERTVTAAKQMVVSALTVQAEAKMNTILNVDPAKRDTELLAEAEMAGTFAAVSSVLTSAIREANRDGVMSAADEYGQGWNAAHGKVVKDLTALKAAVVSSPGWLPSEPGARPPVESPDMIEALYHVWALAGLDCTWPDGRSGVCGEHPGGLPGKCGNEEAVKFLRRIGFEPNEDVIEQQFRALERLRGNDGE